jgi:hypothetical protein
MLSGVAEENVGVVVTAVGLQVEAVAAPVSVHNRNRAPLSHVKQSNTGGE